MGLTFARMALSSALVVTSVTSGFLDCISRYIACVTQFEHQFVFRPWNRRWRGASSLPKSPWKTEDFLLGRCGHDMAWPDDMNVRKNPFKRSMVNPCCPGIDINTRWEWSDRSSITNVCVPSSVVLWYFVLYLFVAFGCSLVPFKSWAMQVLHRASPSNELVASIEGGRGKVGRCE